MKFLFDFFPILLFFGVFKLAELLMIHAKHGAPVQ